jgi:4-nitrophenyl phosphatase
MHKTPNGIARLREVRAVLLDMDGVLYVGDQALPGVQELLDALDESGRRWLCVTNNSSRTPKTFSDKLAGMGISVSPDNILGSAQATAEWLAQQADAGAKVIMMGEESLRAALVDRGFSLVDDPFEAEYVVASICFDVNYSILTDVTLAIRNGARFIATNPDPTLPTERGQVPGTGSLIALLTAASEQQPEYVGKPYEGMYQQAMRRTGTAPAATLMVGDRYETDIIGAIELGMPTAGVLTGVTTREQYAAVEKQPDILVEDLPELLSLFRQADER